MERFGCFFNTIKVAAGHYFDLMNPDPEAVELKSIAAALSKTCRYGGHCPRFYSVAEHCIHAANLAHNDGYVGVLLQSILLHDAAEAYIGDMVKPLKVNLPEFQKVEDRIASAIEVAFGVDFGHWHSFIKHYDWVLMKAEKLAFWPNDNIDWTGFEQVAVRPVNFQYWGPDEAEKNFIELAHAIGIDR